MHRNRRPFNARVAGLIVAASASLVVSGAAQAPGPTPSPPPPRFPAQQRPPDDPQVVARGKRVYDVSCRACHGTDLRGGDMGGPNLLRSNVMLNDDNGDLLRPILQGSRARMPAIDLAPEDAVAVAAFVHSILAQGRAQGAPPAAESVPVNILVGDATQGQVYFAAKCSTCHSVTGDLQGIGTRTVDPLELQNLWVAGGKAEPFDAAVPPGPRDAMVVVTLASGQVVEGRLDRIDDFMVSVIRADGRRQSFRRVGNLPQVDIRDPLAAHRQLLETYTDRDIHNVTAYLVTVK